jgi:hypothetical protein
VWHWGVDSDCVIRSAALEPLDERVLDGQAHGPRADGAAPCAREIDRAQAIRQHAVHRGHHVGGLPAEARGMAEQHGDAQDRADGIGGIAPSQVGRRAVYRLVECDRPPERGRRQQPERTAESGGLIAQDVSEEVVREDHVEVPRVQHETQRARVDVHVLEPDVRVFATYLGDHRTPELRGFEHVGLVHRGHEATPDPRFRKGHMRDAGDLRARIAQRVPCGPADVVEPARLGEVQAAEQLAHDQDIGTANARGSDRADVRQRVVAGDRTQVGEPAERLAERQESGLGPRDRGKMLERRMPDGAEQHRIGVQAGVARSWRQRHAHRTDGLGANRMLLEADVDPAGPSDSLEDAHGLARDLGSDAVTGQHRDAEARHRVTTPQVSAMSAASCSSSSTLIRSASGINRA